MNFFQKFLLIVSVGFLLFQQKSVSNVVEETFTNIYENGEWGRNSENEGCSGPGSTFKTTKDYRTFLQDFLKGFHIKSVVDFGCGDWEFSQHIDWHKVNYIGYDVVKPVIEKNQLKFTKSNIHFIHGNGLETALPTADLLICKDVLQHLSIENINKFLKQTSKFKYCLITNDVYPNTLTSDNPEIPNGSYRPLDLTKPPFNVNGTKILTYHAGFNTKQVLLITRK